MLVDEFRDRDVPLAGIMVDYPVEYDGTERIFELQKRAAAQDVPFNMIVNSQSGGQRTDEAFADNTLSYVP